MASSSDRINKLLMPETANRLTPKQNECLSLVADGLTSKEIARALGLSARTVDDHVDKARIKMNAPSRHKAAAIYRAFLASEPSSALPEWAPYELRCEPPALDELTNPEAVEFPTPGLSDGGSTTFEHFPQPVSTEPASFQPPEIRYQPLPPLSVIMRILGTMAVIALLVLAYPKLVESAEKIAGSILTTTAKSREANASR